MSAGEFEASYAAAVQIAMLSPDEKAALARLFSSSEIDQPAVTKPIDDGRFVSSFGSKRVLWHRLAQAKPEILSIVDRSFATGA